MKKYLIILLFPLISFSLRFKDLNDDLFVDTYQLYFNKDKLEVGDILIYKPNYKKIHSIFGHVAIIGEDKKIVDMPNPKISFREMPIELMARFKNRKVMVLRYKHKDKDFEKKFLESLYSNTNYRYDLITPRTDNMYISYCSKLVYDIYEKINNTDTTIFPNDTEYIWPEDFLNAGENFKILNLKENDETNSRIRK